MAHEGTNFFPMGSDDSGDKNEGTGESQTACNNVVQPAAAADKGKGIAVDQNVDEGGSSRGNKRLAEPAASSTNVLTTSKHGKKGKGKGKGKVKGSVGVSVGGSGSRIRICERLHILAERERRRKIKKLFDDLRALIPHLSPKTDKATIVREAISFIRRLEEMVADLERRKREKESLVARYALLGLGGGASSSAPPPPSAAAFAPPVLEPAPAFVPPVMAPYGGSGAMPPPPAAASMLQASPAPGTGGGVSWAPSVLPQAAPAPGDFMVWSAPSVVLNLCGGDQAFINASVARRPGVLTMIVEVLERHSIEIVTAQISSDESRSLFTYHTRVDRQPGMFMDTLTPQEIYQLALSEIMVWLRE